MCTLIKSGFTGDEYDYEEWNEFSDGDWGAMFVLAPRGMRCANTTELPGFIRSDAICLNFGWHLFCCRPDMYAISPQEAGRFLFHSVMEHSGAGYLLPSHGSREPFTAEIVELLQRLAPDLNIQSGDGTSELSEKAYRVRGFKPMQLSCNRGRRTA